jgi:hypothetical protein
MAKGERARLTGFLPPMSEVGPLTGPIADIAETA